MAVTNTSAIDFLAGMCARWGGSLDLLSDQEWHAEVAAGIRRPGFSVFPGMEGGDAHALDWLAKRVLVARLRAAIQPIIHEMGHVFASLSAPDDSGDEFAFCGWEVAVARAAGCFGAWARGLAEVHYQVGDADWGDLSTEDRHDVITERLGEAERLGLIDEHHRPLSVR